MEKNSRASSANIGNALTNFCHTVFINMRVSIEFSKIMYNLQTVSVVFGNTKIGELYIEEDL